MSRLVVSLVALVTLSGASAFLAPVSSGGQMLLRSATAAKSLAPRASLHRRVQISAVKMQEDGNDSAPTPPAPAELDEEEMARRYRQQNSGTGYRKNSQDGLLFAMGGMVLLIPFIAVGIAIGTGYIPLDYLR